MNDHRKMQTPVEKHYEKRWLEARNEIFKDADAIIDVLINIHDRCSSTAEKHKVSEAKLTTWFFNQLPIDGLCLGDEEPEEDFEE